MHMETFDLECIKVIWGSFGARLSQLARNSKMPGRRVKCSKVPMCVPPMCVSGMHKGIVWGSFGTHVS